MYIVFLEGISDVFFQIDFNLRGVSVLADGSEQTAREDDSNDLNEDDAECDANDDARSVVDPVLDAVVAGLVGVEIVISSWCDRTGGICKFELVVVKELVLAFQSTAGFWHCCTGPVVVPRRVHKVRNTVHATAFKIDLSEVKGSGEGVATVESSIVVSMKTFLETVLQEIGNSSSESDGQASSSDLNDNDDDDNGSVNAQ